MGRASITLGTSDGRPVIVDRSAGGTIRRAQEPTRDSAIGALGTGLLLPEAAGEPWQTQTFEEMLEGQEVVLNEVWSQLSACDRQCFGHRFSGMALKALGLRPCPIKEVDA
jgi:hypothetical protein